MTPEPALPYWGWNAPARVALILVVAAFAGSMARSSRRDSPGPAELPSLVVDLNAAPAPVLEALPGLGPALASRIVEAREAAPIRSLDDFDRRVRGIGPAKSAALRPYLRFGPASTP